MLGIALRIAAVLAGTGWAASHLDTNLLQTAGALVAPYLGQGDAGAMLEKAREAIRDRDDEHMEPPPVARHFFQIDTACPANKTVDLDGRIRCSEE